ncbi:MAG TPA: apolipoprotein N-acyltransferase [Candidatus Krumholzibacteria bacterium]|nr:apolipoprotein N-acyltransferase [Candidatus Krumholzibacteria bacterium]
MKWLPGRILPPLPLIAPALLSGVLVTLCFPITSLGPVVFLALAPVFVAALRHRPGPRDSFRTGLWVGVACFGTMMWWILMLSPAADATIPLLSKIIPHALMMPLLLTPGLMLLAAYLGCYVGLTFLALAYLTRWRLPLFVLAAPALWTLFEVARCRGELAFPWGVLGYSLSDHPALLQTADIWGVFGLSFLIVLVNALIAGMVVARGPRGKAVSGLLACALAAGLYLYGNAAMTRVQALAAPMLRVAVAQPNIDLAIKWKPEFKDSTFNQIDLQSLEASQQGAQLVIFPETCAPVYIENAPQYKSRLEGLAAWLDVPIYVGFLDHRYDGPGETLNIYNSSGVFLPDGTIEKYDKRHLLPFGEALPLAQRFRSLRKIDFGQANFQPGPRRPPLRAAGAAFTPLICFESVFPDLCREGVEDGSQLLVNVTNDGWFGDTPGPYQHAQMSIARAVEFRRYLVRSANSGVSMVVAPTGEIVSALSLYQPGVLMADVKLLGVKTVYARFGDMPLIVICLLLAVAAGLALRVRDRQAPAN